MANVPDDRRYTDQHEWALAQAGDGGDSVVRVGITDHAQDALGDIVFVQLPAVGDEVVVDALRPLDTPQYASPDTGG